MVPCSQREICGSLLTSSGSRSYSSAISILDVIFGWYTAEMGRQPWVVYGLLRTSDALSKAVTANQVLFSLIMFTLIYALLLVLFIYLLNKKIKHGPDDNDLIDQRPGQKGMADSLGPVS